MLHFLLRLALGKSKILMAFILFCYAEILLKYMYRGVMRSAASSYAAMRMVAGSRPVFVIV